MLKPVEGDGFCPIREEICLISIIINNTYNFINGFRKKLGGEVKTFRRKFAIDKGSNFRVHNVLFYIMLSYLRRLRPTQSFRQREKNVGTMYIHNNALLFEWQR